MNSKNKKRNKLKNKRRVVLLKCKDSTERLILTKTVKIRNNNVNILQCNTEIVTDMNRTTDKDEKYPIFRGRNRIVPTCFRDNCRRQMRRKDQQCRWYRRNKSIHEPKQRSKLRSETPIIISSDTDSDDVTYDNISSGSMSSYSTDDEIDALMDSTRKRMRETDKEWKLIPRQVISRNNFENNFISSKCPSLNSLDTLILEAEDEMMITNTSSSSDCLPLNQEKIIKLEPQVDNKEVKASYESVGKFNESSYITENYDLDKNISSFSPIIKPENIVKSEVRQSYNELTSTCEATQHVHNDYSQKIKAEPTNHVINGFSINSPEIVVKNELIETTIVTQERIYGMREQKYDKISTVIAKLEREEFNPSLFKPDNIDIKQELYSDI